MTGSFQTLVGTAGWSIPRASAPAFPTTGTHLERYASIFAAVEINSSFYRAHRRVTYERWAASTAEDFRFCVKLPKEISHVLRLVGSEAALDAFVDQVGGLGRKLEVILVQLPPSLAFDRRSAAAFFDALRGRLVSSTEIACEPRHATWFGAEAEACLVEHRVARVAADPPPVEGADRPGGWAGLRYYRLHGSPRIYSSSYDRHRLEGLAEGFAADLAARCPTWCVFDNTASGAATQNALCLHSLIAKVVGQATTS